MIVRSLFLLPLLAAVTVRGGELRRMTYNNPAAHPYLKVGLWAWPMAIDYDGDGALDLVVACGDVPYGGTHFYRNPGGGPLPVFARDVPSAAGGRLTMDLAMITPSAVDWDGDGLPDLMVNSIWGDVVWYRNVGTRRKPALAAAADVEVEWDGVQPEMGFGWYQPSCKRNPRGLLTQWRTTPMMYDWNGDGLMDLVMLDKEGYLALYERTRRDGRLLLLPPKRAFANDDGSALRLNARVRGHSGRTKFALADWNGDGRCDLILNSKNAAVRLNLGERDGRTVFGPPANVSDRKLSNHTTSPTTVDFDADGQPELVIGAEDGYFYYLSKR